MTLDVLLIGDGPTDEVLSRPLEWTLRILRPSAVIGPIRFVKRAPLTEPLDTIVDSAFSKYSPSILVVHRDAEVASHDERVSEIPIRDGVVPLVPVRMTEAWFFGSEAAIRKAANNPNGTVPLNLPNGREAERMADPKARWMAAILSASEASGRRLQHLRRDVSVRRVADYIEDYSYLEGFVAYRSFRHALQTVLDRMLPSRP